MLRALILIFLGGGTGSVLRYLITIYGKHLVPQSNHPTGWEPFATTFIANIVGCFLIGLFNNIAARHGMAEDTRLMLTTGLCGGFTTFSTFSSESLAMLHAGNYLIFSLYLLFSIVVGIAAVLLGSSL